MKVTSRVTGKVVCGIPCLVFIHNGTHFAVAINGSALVAAWS